MKRHLKVKFKDLLKTLFHEEQLKLTITNEHVVEVYNLNVKNIINENKFSDALDLEVLDVRTGKTIQAELLIALYDPDYKFLKKC